MALHCLIESSVDDVTYGDNRPRGFRQANLPLCISVQTA